MSFFLFFFAFYIKKKKKHKRKKKLNTQFLSTHTPKHTPFILLQEKNKLKWKNQKCAILSRAV